jgi:hypothetical protein
MSIIFGTTILSIFDFLVERLLANTLGKYPICSAVFEYVKQFKEEHLNDSAMLQKLP